MKLKYILLVINIRIKTFMSSYEVNLCSLILDCRCAIVRHIVLHGFTGFYQINHLSTALSISLLIYYKLKDAITTYNVKFVYSSGGFLYKLSRYENKKDGSNIKHLIFIGKTNNKVASRNTYG